MLFWSVWSNSFIKYGILKCRYAVDINKAFDPSIQKLESHDWDKSSSVAHWTCLEPKRYSGGIGNSSVFCVFYCSAPPACLSCSPAHSHLLLTFLSQVFLFVAHPVLSSVWYKRVVCLSPQCVVFHVLHVAGLFVSILFDCRTRLFCWIKTFAHLFMSVISVCTWGLIHSNLIIANGTINK